MKPIFLAASLTALTASTALAGSLAEPVIEPVVPVAAYEPVGEWTGFYMGGQLGYGSADAPGADYDGAIGGLHFGYLHDLGDWVIGGELDYDAADMGGPAGTEIDRIGRAKLLAGYDMGPSLIYATVGAFSANVAAPGGDTDDTGAFIGAGWKYQITENWVGGIEALYHQKDDFGGVAGNDLDATTITARISYKF